jgi:hypothetical protein
MIYLSFNSHDTFHSARSVSIEFDPKSARCLEFSPLPLSEDLTSLIHVDGLELLTKKTLPRNIIAITDELSD